jgi:uncharacterized protein (DUF2252 family)
MSPDPPWRMNRRAPATRQSGLMTATASRTRQPEVLTPEERVAHGKEARKRVPLEMHAEYAPRPDRLDPVALLEGQAMTRVPDLVPLRYGRMLVSPFTFYRGAALVMAADLAPTPVSGFRAQLCGDAHLSNFGLFATPERRMIFDVNDFDETLPGPWEWDVKRFIASLTVAGRENGYSRKERRKVAMSGAAAYRMAMRGFADSTNLDVFYASADLDSWLQQWGDTLTTKQRRRTEANIDKARTHDSMQALGKLTELVDGHRRIISDPPVLVPIEALFPEHPAQDLYAALREVFSSYRRSLQPDRRVLVDQFRMVQVARKVVGVGSVGTRSWIILFLGRDEGDPLFLQAKEAQPSVLEAYAGASAYGNQGRRVVAGQQLMQAASDIFLGATQASGVDGTTPRDFYIRQLRDGKGSADIEHMVPTGMEAYAQLCGWTLARAHACSGDRIAIASYLGRSDRFERALADFGETYADQNEADFHELEAAERTGRIKTVRGL